jgi:hypothetical protein
MLKMPPALSFHDTQTKSFTLHHHRHPNLTALDLSTSYALGNVLGVLAGHGYVAVVVKHFNVPNRFALQAAMGHKRTYQIVGADLVLAAG